MRGLATHYDYIPGSPSYNPDADYGPSLLDMTHKVVIAPIVELPFGRGRAYINKGGWRQSDAEHDESQRRRPAAEPGRRRRSAGARRHHRPSQGEPGGQPVSQSRGVFHRAGLHAGKRPAHPAGPSIARTVEHRSRARQGIPAGPRRPRDGPRGSAEPVQHAVVQSLASSSVGAANFAQVTTQANLSRFTQFTFRLSC